MQCRIIWALWLCLMAFAPLNAHIGSPGVVMQGKAGPYELMVQVEPPDVIPGVAKVTVFAQGNALQKVMARAIYYRTGDEGAPRPDELKPVPGSPGQFAGEVWMMVTGSSSVQLQVTGGQGEGTLVVPVVAVSTAVRQMPQSTGFMLSGLGLFLVILMMTVTGAAVSDAITKKGETLSPRRRRFKKIGFAAGLLACGALLYGGNAWWQSWAADYMQYKYTPLQARSKVVAAGDTQYLHFQVDTVLSKQRLSNLNFVVPDHGKMMHLFIMRIPEMDAFAHLHPQRIDSVSFTSILPSLPKGRYLIFADIVYLSGYTETIKDTLEIAQAIKDHTRKMDIDDAYAFALPANLVDATPPPGEEEQFFVCGKPGTGVKLKNGSRMVWEGQKDEAMYAGRLYNLQFAVYDSAGREALLDPYLGMAGHAAVVRNDGNVYIHMHPSGNANMAAVQVLNRRIADTARLVNYPANAAAFRDSVDGWMNALSNMPKPKQDSMLAGEMPFEHNNMAGITMNGNKHSHMLQFPYVFPAAGQYRIWVQVKLNGQVQTAAFDKWIE